MDKVAKATNASKGTAATPANKPAEKPASKPAAKKAPARKPAAKKPAAPAAMAEDVIKAKATLVVEPVKQPQPDKSATGKPKADAQAKPAPAPEKPAPAQTEPTAEPAPAKPGILPMILAGVVTAALGFGAAMYLQSTTDVTPDLEQKLSQQNAALNALKSDVAALSGGPDLSGIEAELAQNTSTIAGLSKRLGSIETQLGALNARLTKLEERQTQAGPSDTANAADIAALRAALAEQKAQLEALTAAAAEQDKIANESARATLRRAALTRVQTALDSGSGFASALADLEATGVAIPAALKAVAGSGVASLGELQESFPDAARAALAAARKAAPKTGAGGLTAFLRDQLGARSLEPKPGNDPDAILSRVEAAVRDNRLSDALAEIETLPEVARVELSDWAGAVARRLEAVAAAEQLGRELN